jgi:hypothetical protein
MVFSFPLPPELLDPSARRGDKPCLRMVPLGPACHGLVLVFNLFCIVLGIFYLYIENPTFPLSEGTSVRHLAESYDSATRSWR